MHLKTEIIIILCNQVVNSFAVALGKSIPNSMQPLVVWFCLAFSLASLLLVVVFLLWRRFVVSLCALLEDETTKQQSNSNTQNRKHQNNERSNKRTTTTTIKKGKQQIQWMFWHFFLHYFFVCFETNVLRKERERDWKRESDGERRVKHNTETRVRAGATTSVASAARGKWQVATEERRAESGDKRHRERVSQIFQNCR